MSKRKPPETESQLAKALARFFNEQPVGTPEDLDEDLREEGYDPAEFAARIQTLAEEALAVSPLNWRNRQKALERARVELENTASFLPTSRGEVLAAIQQLLSRPQNRLASAHFRNQNLTEMSDEELKTFFQELRYLADQDSREDGE